MEMKWHPIINGDLSGIPLDEEFLFTVFDEEDCDFYVTTAYIVEYEGETEVRNATAGGLLFYKVKNVKAWMDFPNPYNQNQLKTTKREELEKVVRAMKKIASDDGQVE